MSRKDYIAIAGIIRKCKHGISTASQAKLADELCELFLFDNEWCKSSRRRAPKEQATAT